MLRTKTAVNNGGFDAHEKTPEDQGFPIHNGEAGIRTRGTGLTPYNGLANRRLKPLGHPSKQLLGLLKFPTSSEYDRDR